MARQLSKAPRESKDGTTVRSCCSNARHEGGTRTGWQRRGGGGLISQAVRKNATLGDKVLGYVAGAVLLPYYAEYNGLVWQQVLVIRLP